MKFHIFRILAGILAFTFISFLFPVRISAQTETPNPIPTETTYTSQYPPEQNSTYVKATTTFSSLWEPWLATDPRNPITGADSIPGSRGYEWISGNGNPTDQRFHIDLGLGYVIKRIYIEASHNYDNPDNDQFKNFTFWGSNDHNAFNDLTYGNDTNWTQLTTSPSFAREHITSDVSDPQYFTVSNSTAYRYYAFKFADNWGSGNYMGVRRIELQTDDAMPTPTPIPVNYESVYPPAFNSTYVKATSRDVGYESYFGEWVATDPSKGLTGDQNTGTWISNPGNNTNQRFHIDLGSPHIIKRFYFEQANHFGDYSYGAKNYTFWGSNSADAFADITYGDDANWTELSVWTNTFAPHTGDWNVPSPQHILVMNDTPFRYYALKIADNYGYPDYMGFRRIELQQEIGAPTPTPTPIPIAPTVQAITGATITESATYSTTGSFTDPDSTYWTATVDYGDGSGVQSLPLSGKNFTLTHQYKDEGSYSVSVAVTDDQSLLGTGSATVTVTNAPFTVSMITAPTAPVQVNTAISASASFTDPGVLDTHTASWNWGDGNTTTGTVTESNGSGSVSDTHTYTAAGVYTVTLTVTDDDGVSVASPPFQYVVVYNLTGGFFTASGKYNSLAGWDIQNPQATGGVKFGVQAKYTSGNTPTGQSKITFKVGSLDFSSTSNNWLVVTGAKAYLEGNGTINGSDNYNFLISGIDGSQTGGQSFIRVRITDLSNNVVYDSQPGIEEAADPTTPLTNGSVKVH